MFLQHQQKTTEDKNSNNKGTTHSIETVEKFKKLQKENDIMKVTNKLLMKNLAAEKEMSTLRLDELERSLLQANKKMEQERKAHEAALEAVEKEKNEANQ